MTRLPPLYRGTLDPDEARALIETVETETEVLDTRTDGRRVRLQYRHDGAEWIDTLTFKGDTVDLVRIRHEIGEDA